jgi:hypothetical protein
VQQLGVILAIWIVVSVAAAPIAGALLALLGVTADVTAGRRVSRLSERAS